MVEAANAFSQARYKAALNHYVQISEKTSKIMFNMARCYQLLGELKKAQQCYSMAFEKDRYFAVAYFAAANCSLMEGKEDKALRLYQKSLDTMNPALSVDYKQIGLDFVLDVSEIYYNMAVALYAVGQVEKSRQMLSRSFKRIQHSLNVPESISSIRRGYLAEKLKFQMERQQPVPESGKKASSNDVDDDVLSQSIKLLFKVSKQNHYNHLYLKCISLERICCITAKDHCFQSQSKAN